MDEYLHDICLCNRYTGEIFYDHLGYTFIELSKFVKTETELSSELDNWLFVLKNMSRIDKIPVYLRKPIFEKLFNIAAYSNLTKEEKTMYDSHLKSKWDNKNVLDYAKKEGRIEGIKEGVLEGVKQTAKKMKLKGVEPKFIAEITELSIEEIEKL